MRPNSRIRRLFSAFLLVLAGSAVGASPAPSLPSATPPTAKAAAFTTFLAPDLAEHALRLELPPVEEARVAAAKAANAPDASAIIAKRLTVGIGRETAGYREAQGTQLAWTRVADGFAARWEVRSPGAKALRIALAAGSLPEGVQLRYAGSDSASIYGPVGRDEILRAGQRYWGPVVEGDTATIEIFVPAGVDPSAAVALWIAGVSHLFASPMDPKADVTLKAGSLSCEVNLICRSGSDPALAKAGTAVARMVFTDTTVGKSYLCTGTVLNNAAGTFVPYFATASHCIATQADASTLATLWFYETTTCTGTGTNPNRAQRSGGATLLYADPGRGDFTLLRLNDDPPAGVTFAGWNAATVSTGLALLGIHHPEGDVKKVSAGSVGGLGLAPSDLGVSGSFIRVNWNSTATGFTEGGSSGSGLFVRNPASQSYEFRGGLMGGYDESCTSPQSDLVDWYSRFDLAYTAVAQFLSPSACTYTISSSGSSIAASGGPGSFTIAAGGNCNWTAVSGSSWISTGSVGSGNGTVTFTVAANIGAARSGVITVGGQTFTITQAAALATAATNYTALWSKPGEDGWGLNIAHAGDTIFASLYTYSNDGQPMWLYGSNLARQADGSFTGGLYRATGPAFDAQPWGAIANTQVGTITLAFGSATAGTLSYTFNGAGVSKAIARFDFASPVPTCSATTDSRATATNYQDLWWNPAESGWGLDIAHQGNIIFASLFTYDDTGRDLWLYASNAARQADGSFAGSLYRATGPAFNAAPWGAYTPSAVGTFSLRFASGEAGTLTYIVGSKTVVKSITRFPVASSATVCR